jgi:hypothetical protein
MSMRIASRQLGHHHGTAIECAAERNDLVHTCYYGSSCIDASNEFGLLDRYCDCDSAEALVAGLMCQYEATVICTTGQKLEDVTDQYCVNGGQCIALVDAGDSHPGCICETDTWEGKHCEYSHGLLFDDALDLFQQRKEEISAGKLMNDVGDHLMTTVTVGDDGERGGILLFFIVCTIISVLVIVPLSILASRMLRKRQRRSDDSDYQNIGRGSWASSNGTENSCTPPSDVFLSSRKKEISPDAEHSSMLSPGTPVIDTHEDDTGDVEMLDAEASRIIEAQFERFDVDRDRGSQRPESSNEDTGAESPFTPSYDSDEEDINRNSAFLGRKITINCGISRSRPLAEFSPNIGCNGLVVVDEGLVKNEASCLDDPMHYVGGVSSLDANHSVDLDEVTYYV